MKPRVPAVLGAMVLLGGVAGWFRPVVMEPAAATAGTGQWRLPGAQTLERSTLAQYQAIADVRWVGGSAEPNEASIQWTLLGLVGELNARAILVRVDGDPLIKRVRSGDTLPDGSKLVSVGNGAIVIERDGCQVRHALYPGGSDQSQPQPPEGDCQPPETN